MVLGAPDRNLQDEPRVQPNMLHVQQQKVQRFHRDDVENTLCEITSS